jgi:hypothetical protein
MSWLKAKPPQSVGRDIAAASDCVVVLNFGGFGPLNLFRISGFALGVWDLAAGVQCCRW